MFFLIKFISTGLFSKPKAFYHNAKNLFFYISAHEKNNTLIICQTSNIILIMTVQLNIRLTIKLKQLEFQRTFILPWKKQMFYQVIGQERKEIHPFVNDTNIVMQYIDNSSDQKYIVIVMIIECYFANFLSDLRQFRNKGTKNFIAIRLRRHYGKAKVKTMLE